MNKCIILVLFFLLSACGEKNESSSSTVKEMIIKPSVQKSNFFYSGIIQPSKTVVVTSPADGVIAEMAIHYGDPVQPHEKLFSIKSDKFQSDYKNAFMQYIKAKTEFNNAESQLKESDFLHKNQLISDDDFKSKQLNFYTAQLSLVQAKDLLSVFLKQLKVTQFDVYQLSIENIDKITEALHMDANSQTLQIESPSAGIVLLPIQSDGNDTQTKKISKGDQVKQGDVLAMIGDVHGFLIHININEFNVNELKVGQPVEVTGVAFPQFILKGHIAAINRQAESNASGQPVFSAEVVVPTLTCEEEAHIHIGMSAKVAIQTESPPVMSVPINAVFEKNGVSFVMLKREGKVQEVPVKTGQTSRDSVVIESPLKTGDILVIAH